MLTLPDTDRPLEQAPRTGAVQQRITLPTPWLTGQPLHQSSIDLTVSYEQSALGWSATLFESAAAHSRISLDAPVTLEPVAIAKPWGQEIWFTGIEQRGESSVRQGDTVLPLSHYLAMAPGRLANRVVPVLLKILDPAPEVDTGNLYFETHDTKREVYVVTSVDTAAWPDATGAIRLGMNQQRRTSFASDAEFRAAYLEAVKNYEGVRRAIDSGQSATHGQPLDAQEAQLRAEMESFTTTVPLRRGDVVQVNPGIPHSLQHGVRVFEFQTPTYERNIISFNQKVLTQDHWDSSYAIGTMSLDGPQDPVIETLSVTQDLRVERIVDFESFLVLRVTLSAHCSWAIEHQPNYALLAMIEGSAQLETAAGSVHLSAQQSVSDLRSVSAFLPASAVNATLTAQAEPAVALLALPKPAAAGTIPVSETATDTSSPL